MFLNPLLKHRYQADLEATPLPPPPGPVFYGTKRTFCSPGFWNIAYEDRFRLKERNNDRRGGIDSCFGDLFRWNIATDE